MAPIQLNQQRSEPTQCKEVRLRDQLESNVVNDMIAEMIAADLVIEEQRESARLLHYANFIAFCRERGFDSEDPTLRALGPRAFELHALARDVPSALTARLRFARNAPIATPRGLA